MNEEKIFSQEVKDAYDRMVEAYTSIEFNEISLLTGENGSGKSMIRKQLPFLLRDKLELEDTKATQGMIASTSMDARTGSNAEWGALSGIMRDDEWVATSQSTFSSLKGLFNVIRGEKSKAKYLVIDEFEIGCGEETALALCNYINANIKDLIETTTLEGAMIITHSRIGAEHLKYDKFVNIEGMNKEEWMNREIVPTDLEKLDENELFFYIRDNTKK